jgi:hypothetical protein
LGKGYGQFRFGVGLVECQSDVVVGHFHDSHNADVPRKRQARHVCRWTVKRKEQPPKDYS